MYKLVQKPTGDLSLIHNGQSLIDVKKEDAYKFFSEIRSFNVRVCLFCGGRSQRTNKVFKATGSLYCSDSCRVSAHYRRQVDRYKGTRERKTKESSYGKFRQKPFSLDNYT